MGSSQQPINASGKWKGRSPRRVRRRQAGALWLLVYLLATFACTPLIPSADAWATPPKLRQSEEAESFRTTNVSASSQPQAIGSSNQSGGPDQKASLLQMIFKGSPIGVAIVGLIILLSMISVFFMIEHALTITRARLIPDQKLAELDRLIKANEINEAIQYCYQDENASLSTDVILAGLERYNSSEFGFAEYRSAVEEAGEDQTGRLYRKTEVLNVIAAIAPMLGLTGTVIGMIDSFNTIATKQGVAQPGELAGGIGQALITTLLGLLVAIPTMVAVSYFRNKIDSLVAEAGKRVERVLLPLGRKK